MVAIVLTFKVKKFYEFFVRFQSLYAENYLLISPIGYISPIGWEFRIQNQNIISCYR
ncbi:hypothetical protein FORC47_3412 [Bacillus cereus]|nr:hypothetical protein FORC47_3412 [Bacillus cereus]